MAKLREIGKVKRVVRPEHGGGWVIQGESCTFINNTAAAQCLIFSF